jgi:hypothetical protein
LGEGDWGCWAWKPLSRGARLAGLAAVSLRRPKFAVVATTLIGEESPDDRMAREGVETGKPPEPARSCIDLDASRRRKSGEGAALMGVSSSDMRDEADDNRGKGMPVELLVAKGRSARRRRGSLCQTASSP